MNRSLAKIISMTLLMIIVIGGIYTMTPTDRSEVSAVDWIANRLISAEAERIERGEDAFVGLSDVSKVGVDADRMANEEIFPVTEGEYDLVIDASLYGVIPNDSKDDSIALASIMEDISKASEDGAKVLLKLPAGELDFTEGLNPSNRSCAIYLSGISNLTVLGEGTMLTIHGAMDGILIDNCHNIAIKGISYDYGRAPFSVGEIESSTDTSVKVKFREHYPITETTNFNDYLEFDKYAHLPRVNGNFMLSSDITSVDIEGQNVTFNFKGKINKPVKGTLVVASHYTYGNEAIYVTDSSKVTLECIDVYTAAGMGIVGLTSRDITLNRVNVRLKPNTDRLMSTTADGMHFGACRGKLSVTNCLVENTHDDACNVKAGHYFGVSNIDWTNNSFKCVNINYMHRIEVGDTLVVYSANLEELARVEVAAIPNEDGSGIFVKANGELPDVLSGDCIVANLSTVPEFVFENNVVKNKRNRGVLMQTRNATIRNNAFINVGHGAICVTTEASQFNEAIVPQNVLIENNKIMGCNGMGSNVGGDIAVLAYGQNWIGAPSGTIKNVIIHNNFIANVAKRAINVGSVSDTTISNNLIYNPARNPISKQNDCAISLSVSEDVTIKENYVSNNSSSAEYVSLFTDGTVPESEVILEGNVGLAFTTMDVSVQPDNVYRLPDGVTVDMNSANLDEFANVEETINFIGYTDAYGKETVPTEENVSIKTFKVCYDDNGIYVAFEIRDDVVHFVSSSSFWMGDGIEIFFTSAVEETYAFPIIRQSYDDTAQLYITTDYTYLETARTSLYLQHNRESAFKVKSWKTSDGYAGKVFISFDVCTELGALAKDGGVMSCSFVVADMDPGKDRLQISNTMHNVENNKGIPAMMGKLRFA